MLEKLRAYDTPTICNVIELFDVRPRTEGFMNKSIQAAYPELPPLVGYASTLTCRTAVYPQEGEAYLKLSDQVSGFAELPGDPVVVFQDLDAPPLAATFGEIMCTTYKAFGAVGLITNGPGRDLDQVRSLDFPVFIDGAVCSHGYIQILDMHVPVHVGGLAIYPGDLIHADLNGVSTIPVDIAADVADACADFVAAEQVILDVVRSGSPSMDALHAAIAEKDELVSKLRQRIRKP